MTAISAVDFFAGSSQTMNPVLKSVDDNFEYTMEGNYSKPSALMPLQSQVDQQILGEIELN